MSNMQFLVDNIKRKIPIEILTKGLVPRRNLGRIKPSLDWLIESEIINGWLLTDLNIISGTETTLDISGCSSYYPNNTMSIVIEVGMKPTNGKKITSVLSIGYGNVGSISGMATIASALVDPIVLSDARIQLVANNVIYVDGFINMKITWLRCVLENDNSFNNIPHRAMFKLGEIALQAAKAYLYNTLKIKISTGEIIQGIPMSTISQIIDEYAGAEEKYNELINSWPAVMTMADPVAKNRFNRMLLPQ